jgi:hypothetical protein
MSAGRDEFARQLRELRIEPELRDDIRLVFPYEIEVGRFAETAARIGLEVPEDFPRNPPGGPHVSPRLIADKGATPGGAGGSAASSFGADFEYWSRPYSNWGRDGYTVKAYLAHLRRLVHTA